MTESANAEKPTFERAKEQASKQNSKQTDEWTNHRESSLLGNVRPRHFLVGVWKQGPHHGQCCQTGPRKVRGAAVSSSHFKACLAKTFSGLRANLAHTTKDDVLHLARKQLGVRPCSCKRANSLSRLGQAICWLPFAGLHRICKGSKPCDEPPT